MYLHPLTYDSVTSAIGHGKTDVRICLYDTVDSTNTEARRAAESARQTNTVLPLSLYAARSQTAGRGRLGRSFYSPPDSGLYMTVLIPTLLPLDRAVGVTAAAAVAACDAIEEVTSLSPSVKWVNDLYLGGKKVCGILTEAVSPWNESSPAYLLVGLGINLTTSVFPDGLRAPAGSLADFMPASQTLDAGRLCGTVVRHLLSLTESGDCYSPACLAAYRRRLLWRGQPITCTRGNDCFDGILRDVDERYRLLVDTADGERLLDSGEVSVRAKT